MQRLFNAVITEPLQDFFRRLIEFMPNFLNSVIILFIGFIAGWFVKKTVVKTLTVLNTERFCTKIGVTQGLSKVGIRDTFTALLGKIFYWLLVFIFIIIALYTLKLPAIENLLEQFFLYLPNIFVAFLLIAVGYILGNFLGNAALIASVNAGMQFSRLLARGIKVVIILLATVMALEQLGIGRDTVIVSFTILFGGIVFAISLAFGLGGKDIARDYLEKRLQGKTENKDDLKHL